MVLEVEVLIVVVSLYYEIIKPSASYVAIEVCSWVCYLTYSSRWATKIKAFAGRQQAIKHTVTQSCNWVEKGDKDRDLSWCYFLALDRVL